jgi:exocyst complex component 4
LKKLFGEYCEFTADSIEKTKKLEENLKDGLDYFVTDRFINVIESGHQLLVPPDASHILIAFKPTVEFMAKLEELAEAKLSNFKVILDDFIFNIYLPKIQEQVLAYQHTNINSIDSFQSDKYPAAEYPLIKSALSIVLATLGICRTASFMPVHSEELFKSLLELLEKYYDKCMHFFKSKISLMKALISDDLYSQDSNNNHENILSYTLSQDQSIMEILLKNTYFGDQLVWKCSNIDRQYH